MKLAIEEAKAGNRALGEYPFGAVVVKGDKVIAKSRNRVGVGPDPTAHAEVGAIRNAAKKLKTRYLRGCVLYSTTEPCAMCTSAVVWANMEGIVFGASLKDLDDFWFKVKGAPKRSSWRKTLHIPSSKVLSKVYPKMFLVKNFMRKECKELYKLIK